MMCEFTPETEIKCQAHLIFVLSLSQIQIQIQTQKSFIGMKVPKKQCYQSIRKLTFVQIFKQYTVIIIWTQH